MGRVTRTIYGCSKIIRLNHAEILALPTTKPVLVPRVSGHVHQFGSAVDAYIQPILVTYTLNWTADYTNIDVTGKIGVQYAGVSPFTNPTFAPGALLAQGHSTTIWTDVGREFDFTPFDVGTIVGQDLVLNVTNGAAGDFTGGGANDFLIVQTCYNVIRGYLD